MASDPDFVDYVREQIGLGDRFDLGRVIGHLVGLQNDRVLLDARLRGDGRRKQGQREDQRRGRARVKGEISGHG